MKNTKKYLGVFQEKNGTYTVKTVMKTKDGYSKSVTKRGFETPKKAYEWKEETKVLYRTKYIYEIENSKTPIENMLDKYLEYKAVSVKASSISNIKIQLTAFFLPFFKGKNFSKITAEDVAEYYKTIANRKVKNSTKNYTITFVLDFVNFLDTMEMIPPEVLRRFKRILVEFDDNEESQHSFLESYEVKALLDTFDSNTATGKMERLMFYMFIYGGFRKGELLALTFKDCDIINNKVIVNKQVGVLLDNGKIKRGIVNQTKNNKAKEVVIPSAVSEMILEYRQFRNPQPTDLIFTKKGKPLQRYLPNEILNKHLEMANLKHVKVHDLRHTFCTMLYDMKLDEQFVASQMGHNSTKTSHEVYEHLTKNRRDKNVEIISNLKI